MSVIKISILFKNSIVYKIISSNDSSPNFKPLLNAVRKVILKSQRCLKITKKVGLNIFEVNYTNQINI